jgi:hypothetical protein
MVVAGSWYWGQPVLKKKKAIYSSPVVLESSIDGDDQLGGKQLASLLINEAHRRQLVPQG